VNRVSLYKVAKLTRFLLIIRELLSKYVQCEDSTEVVKVQNAWLKYLQEEYSQAREKGK